MFLKIFFTSLHPLSNSTCLINIIGHQSILFWWPNFFLGWDPGRGLDGRRHVEVRPGFRADCRARRELSCRISQAAGALPRGGPGFGRSGARRDQGPDSGGVCGPGARYECDRAGRQGVRPG